MTIAEVLANYSNGKLVIDKLVCQYVADNGARVLCRFVFDSDHLYLRKEMLFGFSNNTLQDIELTDDDVQDTLLQVIADFLVADNHEFDIFNRDIEVLVEELLSEDCIAAHELEGFIFKMY